MSWNDPKQIRTHLGEIEYHEFGEPDARPLVFIHLALAAADHWDRVVPLLDDGYRRIVPTLPMGGHRLPADPGADLSPTGLARAIAELLAGLDLRDVVLVGNDTGGALCQGVAADHPERLAGVVLTNCDMYDAFPPKIFAPLVIGGRLPGGPWVLSRILGVKALWGLPNFFGMLTNSRDDEKLARWLGRLRRPENRRDIATFVKGISTDYTNRVAAELRSTDLPILVAWGADDNAFKPSLAERFVSEVPTARLELIPDAKTFTCWDQPERLAELIGEFARTVSRARR